MTLTHIGEASGDPRRVSVRTSFALIRTCPRLGFTEDAKDAAFERDFSRTDKCQIYVIGLTLVGIVNLARPFDGAEGAEVLGDFQTEHWPTAFMDVRIQFISAGAVCLRINWLL